MDKKEQGKNYSQVCLNHKTTGGKIWAGNEQVVDLKLFGNHEFHWCAFQDVTSNSW